MRADPNHVAYVRGDKKFKEDRFAEAAQFFLVALEEWPEGWQAMDALGNSYSEMKKTGKAEQWFRQAIEIAPFESRPNLIYSLGNALFDQGRFDEAMAIYCQVPRGHKTWGLAEKNIALSKRSLTLRSRPLPPVAGCCVISHRAAPLVNNVKGQPNDRAPRYLRLFLD